MAPSDTPLLEQVHRGLGNGTRFQRLNHLLTVSSHDLVSDVRYEYDEESVDHVQVTQLLGSRSRRARFV